MDPLAYQGLFYLSLGVGGFSTLLLGLRSLSLSKAVQVKPNAAAVGTDLWRGKEYLDIVAIYQESHDIKSFKLKRSQGKSFPAFYAGQFISFQIGDQDKVLRSYSISSDAHNSRYATVSIKRLDGGVGSTWFHERNVGDRVLAHAPTGLFTDHELKDEQRVYIAGGIGITPVMSMIRTHLENDDSCPMVLFYGMRTEKDLAFHELLSYLAARFPQFTYVPVLSNKEAGWSGKTGFVNATLIKESVTLAPEARFFMCGPDPMTDKLIADFTAMGIEPERIHLEKFASPASFDRDSLPDRRVKLTYSGETHDYSGKLTILEFLEEKQIDHPFACRVGVCGACKCHVKGAVDEITDSGLTALEKKQGFKLACVAFPAEDIEVAPE